MPPGERTQANVVATDDLIDYRPQLGRNRWQHTRMPPIRQHILALAIAATFDQPRVIGRVVTRQESRWGIESVYQQTCSVLQSRIYGPLQQVNVLYGEPITNRDQQGVGDLLVVDTLKEAEEAAVLTIVLVVHRLRMAATHRTLARPVSEKSLSLPRFIKRVRLVSYETSLDSPEWRNPMRVIPIQKYGGTQGTPAAVGASRQV